MFHIAELRGREPFDPNQAPEGPFVVFEDGREGGALLLRRSPRRSSRRDGRGDPEAFARMEAASRRGLFLAGYAGYELGYALERKFAARPTAACAHAAAAVRRLPRAAAI